jgi:hypothetical protein
MSAVAVVVKHLTQPDYHSVQPARHQSIWCTTARVGIVFELRDIVAAVVPAATRNDHRKSFTYHAERGGPVNGHLRIDLQRDHSAGFHPRGVCLTSKVCSRRSTVQAVRESLLLIKRRGMIFQDPITASANFDRSS